MGCTTTYRRFGEKNEARQRSSYWYLISYIVLLVTNLTKTDNKHHKIENWIEIDTRSRLRAYGTKSEYFYVSEGVRQGFILAPALFNMFLDHVLRTALDKSNGGVKVKYKVNGEILVRTLEEPDEIKELVLSLLYADDMAIVCDNPRALEQIVVKLD